MQMHVPLLSIIVFLPLIGSLFMLGSRNRTAMHYVALVTTLATFAFSLVPLFYFNPELAGFQLEEYFPWIPAWGISYHLGIDGLSLFLLPLTGLLSVLAVLVSWKRITVKERAYFFSFLILETGMLGVFVSLTPFYFMFSGKQC